MLKFKFDYLNNTLAYQTEDNVWADVWSQIAEEQQFQGDFGSLGFKLGSDLDSGWIAFTVYENKIRAFFKYREEPYWIVRYRKDLPKDCPVIFSFTEADQIEKINGKWVKKGGNHAN